MTNILDSGLIEHEDPVSEDMFDNNLIFKKDKKKQKKEKFNRYLTQLEH